MSFWSGEKLRDRLPSLIDKFVEGNIDCAAYTLTMGRELYVTAPQTAKPELRTRQHLTERQSFYIPAGQFAFLLSEEIVQVPDDALGFISIKARTKWKGLVNVSGFHVDPGFKGKLVFSVFNAGPGPIHLSQGQPLFLIWYADLDRKSQKIKNAEPQLSIHTDLINGLAGEVHSLAGLDERIRSIEKEQHLVKGLFAALLAIALLVASGQINQCNQRWQKIDEMNGRLTRVEAQTQAVSRTSFPTPLVPTPSAVLDAGTAPNP